MLGEILTAIVTPFHADGRVNVEKFRELCAQLVDDGSDGVVVCGTTGESPTLTDEEKVELWQSAVHEVGGRATVIAGTGTYSTAHSVHLTEEADRAGVDAFLVVTPYYNKPPSARHRRALPRDRGGQRQADRRLQHPEPRGGQPAARDAGRAGRGDPDRAARSSRRTPISTRRSGSSQETDLELYAGDDNLVLPFLQLGGVGGICVRSNIAGRQLKEMITRYREGDCARARQIDEELRPLYELDDVSVNPIPIKTAMNLLG